MRRAVTWMSRLRWSAGKAATAAFELAGMHGTHQVNETSLRGRHSDRKGAAGIAAVLSQLRDSKTRPFVLGSWRFKMEKNSEHKRAKNEETLSDQEILWTIRYLDPDQKDKATDGGVIITIILLALVAIVCLVVALVYSRGM